MLYQKQQLGVHKINPLLLLFTMKWAKKINHWMLLNGKLSWPLGSCACNFGSQNFRIMVVFHIGGQGLNLKFMCNKGSLR
jgi:hypothetical protein